MKEMLEQFLQEKKENRSKFLLRLNLQQHAGEGEGEGEGTGEGSGEGTGEGEGENTGAGNEGNEGESGASKGKSKTFTQDDVNAIAAKEAKKATEKILKQLGVSDFKTAKEGLDKFKEFQDSQKTDAQKTAEKATTLEKANNELSTQVTTLTAQLSALKAGVNPDSLDDVIVLAKNLVTDDVTIDDAIQQVLKKYPNFKVTAGAKQEEGSGKKPPKFTEGEHKGAEKPSEADVWANAFTFGRK